MDSQENRRAQLRKWIDRNGTPTKEKSYFSQLTGGTSSFGERAARRLEKSYGMGEGWLDSTEAAKAPGPLHTAANFNKSIKSQSPSMFAEWGSGVGRNVDSGDLPQPTEEEFAFVPQLNIAAACGNGRFEDEVVVTGGMSFKRTKLRELGVPEHAARMIVAAGGSMWPKIQDGRDVLINTSDIEPGDGNIYAICMPHDGLVLKRLVWEYHPQAGKEVWIIRSDNPDKATFPDKILPPDDRTRIAGRAVWTDSLL